MTTDSPSLKMRKWPVRALEFTPLALTFLLALTLTSIPSARARPSKRDHEDCGNNLACNTRFHVMFKGSEVSHSCETIMGLDVMQERPVLKLDLESDSKSNDVSDTKPEDLVIIFADPDEDDSCNYSVHWVASAELQGNGTITITEDIFAYSPPSPGHRYQLFIYSPEKKIQWPKKSSWENFDLKQFITDNNLGGELEATFQFRSGTQQQA